MPDGPISYVLVDEAQSEHRASIFHLLIESDIALLRCYMTLLELPSTISAIVGTRPPFVDAIYRVRRLPMFRKTSGGHKPSPQMWSDMLQWPLLVVMVAHTPPVWLDELADLRPFALLSPSDEVVETARGVKDVFAGLLRGTQDLRESYRVIGELATRTANDEIFDSSRREPLQQLLGFDLFARRPRLDFFPGLPLPQPSEGRPAVYILNRLTNAVDEPGLMSESRKGGVAVFPQVLNWAYRACAALSVLEMGEEVPKHLDVSTAELQDMYGALTSKSTESDKKYHTFLGLGRRLSAGWPESPFLSVPVPRTDLLRGSAPETLQFDANHKQLIRSGLRAINDVLTGRERTEFANERDGKAYEHARYTLISEQRLLSCQTAWLAAQAGAIPIQLSPLPYQIHNALRDLNSALDAESRKIPELFRRVEAVLAAVLPEGLREHLDTGYSPVILFSDLPFEWTLIDEWPLCLTRPVSRIPIGFSHWETLSAAMESDAAIHIAHPERVLVVDLIDERDAIREHSDAFSHASGSLGQHYTYVSPKGAQELKSILERTTPEIVVLDAHGSYDPKRDRLTIGFRDKGALLDEILPDARVPAVWILSACDTSVTGAIRGCFVRELLRRGAVCVIATLSRVDAFTASMLVGRFLTHIYSPVHAGTYDSLDEVFFNTQLTTALLYDPLLPLLRRADREPALRVPISGILGEFLKWAEGPFEPRKYRHDVAWKLGELLAIHGLAEVHANLTEAGQVRPETLLFTAFGNPQHVRIV